ncbi:MAG: A/G-specific adenine glycosylase [Acetobacteraceae bacterium]|nr:A/G-specific adenine glycosylase [Acetobacteraceae bacterium]MCX7684912.1 A/G-specific adenine glycosylase [Acetobacteraceae bacterium]MDW8396920.1 A/G-specific adenine glycosylase [Acetobacteraceae bacterium]
MSLSARDLLAWYDRHRRTLPFRGEADPYRIWVSEVMLQQTTAAAAGPRFARFVARFPDLATLATAPESAVMEEWAGLGYYARARNLHAGAQALLARGGFPDTPEGLREIPGIGPYTAAAVAAIAFGRPVVPVDANVERVTARLFAVEEPLPRAKPRLSALAQRWMEAEEARARPGDLAQALFDLGATVCTPRAPACTLCPVRPACAGAAAGIAAALPAKAARPPRPLRHGVHFLALRGDGAVWLRRRPPRGLLGGMWEIPGTPWRDSPWAEAEAAAHAPCRARWRAVPGVARHGFTHFELAATLRVARAEGLPEEGWHAAARAEAILPRAMRRLLALAAEAGAMKIAADSNSGRSAP